LSPMVDKLDVRIPADAQLSTEFRKVYADTRGDAKYWRSSERYTSVGDLRPFGIEAILHLGLRHRRPSAKGHSHKLELLDTGVSKYNDWLSVIEGIFDVPVARKKSSTSQLTPGGIPRLEVMRVDLAADVGGVTVEWFRAHMRVLWKRRRAELGEYISQGEGETLYFGKRPNCCRVYNKTAERHEEYKRLARNVSPDVAMPSFEEIYRVSPDATITRVERQLAGGRLPEQVKTLAQLRSLSEFDPFSSVEILPADWLPTEKKTSNCILSLAGERVLQLVQEQGLQRTRQLIRLRDPQNASRTLERLAPFLQIQDERQGVTRERLLELYRDTVSKQLVA